MKQIVTLKALADAINRLDSDELQQAVQVVTSARGTVMNSQVPIRVTEDPKDIDLDRYALDSDVVQCIDDDIEEGRTE